MCDLEEMQQMLGFHVCLEKLDCLTPGLFYQKFKLSNLNETGVSIPSLKYTILDS